MTAQSLRAARAGAYVAAGLFSGALLRADLPKAAETPYLHEEFDNPTTVAERWVPRTGAAAVGHNTADSLSLGADGPRTVLKILGEKQLTDGYPFTCGGVYTREGLGYGYYEMVAKLPLETGWHCSFWTGGGGNEIDAIEIDTGPSSSSSPRHGQFNSHYWLGTTATSKVFHIGWGLDYTNPTDTGRSEPVDVDTSTGYHRYGFEWTPTSIFFYIDGVLKATTRYPGPHSLENSARITMLAYNAGGVGVQAPATMTVDSFTYYRRNYGFPGWNSAAFNVALPVGDSTFSAGLRALDPDQELHAGTPPHVIVSNDFSGEAHWDFPGSTAAASGRYEVFVWNPSMFSASHLSADISAEPEDANANPGGMELGYAIGGQTVVIDSVYGGQCWRGLGAHAFSGATANAITLGLAPGFAPNPMWSLRAGPAVFRPLTRFDDFASGALGSAWTSVSGTWSASGGQAANSSTVESILLRQTSDVTVGDGLVRARISVPASGGATSLGLIARSSADGYYLLRLNLAAATPKLGLLKKTSAGFITLADVTIPAEIDLSAPCETVFVLRNANADDVDLLGFLGGRPVAAVTDMNAGAAFTAAGQVGVRAFGGSGQFDDFGVGQ